jgi:hypothetical protein
MRNILLEAQGSQTTDKSMIAVELDGGSGAPQKEMTFDQQDKTLEQEDAYGATSGLNENVMTSLNSIGIPAQPLKIVTVQANKGLLKFD